MSEQDEGGSGLEVSSSERYEIVGPLAGGAQAETLLCVDRSDGRQLVVKRFRIRSAGSWKEVELAEREARVLRSLSHPNIPAYVDHFEAGGALHLVMELVPGETLDAIRARQGALDAKDVLAFLEDAGAALEYLHSRTPPVIHRDIKPSNVVRRADGRFVLVDFGSVRHELGHREGSTVAGTFGYMPPEQFQGRASAVSDVYAAAATALAALTGSEPEKLPHRGLAIDVDAALGKRAPAGLRRALAAMLEPNPERRAPSVRAMLERHGLSRDANALAKPRRRLGRWAAIAIAATAAAALGLVAIRAAIGGAARTAESGSSGSSCAAEVRRLLDVHDPWAARGRGCADAWAAAETEWVLGNLYDAGKAYMTARRQNPARPLHVSEVEAVTFVDRAAGAELVQRLKRAWYKEPPSAAQAELDCVSRLLTKGDTCPSPSKYVDRFRSWHDLPAYSLHDPVSYVRQRPLFDDTGEPGCGSLFQRLAPLADLVCRGNIGVGRALFFAMSGDATKLERELAVLDFLPKTLEAVAASLEKTPGAARELLVAPEVAGFGRADGAGVDVAFENEWRRLRFDAARLLVVATAAAWFGHDAARVEAYLPHTEAHARVILEEHLALVAGKLGRPDAAHALSDYSDVDLRVLQDLDGIAPEALVQTLKQLRYDSPARFAAFFGPRPRLHGALAAWVRGGFVAPCRSCGIWSLLAATFKRREAARRIGDAALEAKLAEITRKLGTALDDPNYWKPVGLIEAQIRL